MRSPSSSVGGRVPYAPPDLRTDDTFSRFIVGRGLFWAWTEKGLLSILPQRNALGYNIGYNGGGPHALAAGTVGSGATVTSRSCRACGVVRLVGYVHRPFLGGEVAADGAADLADGCGGEGRTTFHRRTVRAPLAVARCARPG